MFKVSAAEKFAKHFVCASRSKRNQTQSESAQILKTILTIKCLMVTREELKASGEGIIKSGLTFCLARGRRRKANKESGGNFDELGKLSREDVEKMQGALVI